MSRLSSIGRDVAYFGVGEGSEAIRGYEPKETWLEWVVQLFPPLLIALVLRGVLGLDERFVGFGLSIVLLVLLAIAWVAALRLAGFGSRSRERSRS